MENLRKSCELSAYIIETFQAENGYISVENSRLIAKYHPKNDATTGLI